VDSTAIDIFQILLPFPGGIVYNIRKFCFKIRNGLAVSDVNEN